MNDYERIASAIEYIAHSVEKGVCALSFVDASDIKNYLQEL